MRNRVRTHGAGEHQQHRAEDRRLDQRKRHPKERFPPGRVQDGRRFLQVRVHVPENASDQDIRERRVVDGQYHGHREQALAPPLRHVQVEQRHKKPVVASRHGIGVEQVLPHDGQGPLGHNIGKNENRAQIFFEFQIGTGDQVGEHTAVQNRPEAGEYADEHGVHQRRPQINGRDALGDPFPSYAAGDGFGKQVFPVIGGQLCPQRFELAVDGLLLGIDRARMEPDGIPDDGEHRENRRNGQDNAQRQQNGVLGFRDIGAEPVPRSAETAGFLNRGSGHRSSPPFLVIQPEWKRAACQCLSDAPPASVGNDDKSGDYLLFTIMSIQSLIAPDTEAQ